MGRGEIPTYVCQCTCRKYVIYGSVVAPVMPWKGGASTYASVKNMGSAAAVLFGGGEGPRTSSLFIRKTLTGVLIGGSHT